MALPFFISISSDPTLDLVQKDQTTSRIKAFYGTSENALKTQIWIALSVYILVAIIRKMLQMKKASIPCYRF